MIDSNANTMGIFKVAMDTFTLAQGRQKGATISATTLERLSRGDKSTRFQTRVRHERFWGNEPTKFLRR
jgi:hypothetical protein